MDIATHFAAHLAQKSKIYEDALQAGGYDRLIIASGFETFRYRDDLHNVFNTNPYFNEWLPLQNNPNCFLIIEPGLKPTLFRYLPNDYWHSAPPSLDEHFMQHFNVHEFTDCPELVLQNAAYIGPENKQFSGIAQNPDKVMNIIDFHRAWKSEYELTCLREANKLAVKGHVAAAEAFYAGKSEYDIHMEYLNAISCQDAELPYNSIVALNENAGVLHHMLLSKQRPAMSRSFLIDAGAPFYGYAADISRTYVHPDGSQVFKQLVAGVDTLQQELVACVTPGLSYVDIHLKSHELVAGLLVESGLIKCSVEEAIANAITSVFLPHGIGHLLGLQVHDKGGHFNSIEGDLSPPPEQHPALRCTRTIEENMVFTIEPGVYFIPQLLASLGGNNHIDHNLLAELVPYGGVRIEDNVVATNGIAENMTRDAYASLI